MTAQESRAANEQASIRLLPRFPTRVIAWRASWRSAVRIIWHATFGRSGVGNQSLLSQEHARRRAVYDGRVPFRRINILSSLSPDDARERLKKLTRTRLGLWEAMTRPMKANPTDPPFIGRVGITFKIHRDIRYGNSFLPIIRGKIVPTSGGRTLVRITMSLPIYTALFMVVWLSGVGFGVAVTIPAFLLRGNAFALVPSGMFALGIGMLWIGFYPEARKAERILRGAFESVASRSNGEPPG
jgi:hypothetical protein